MTIRESEQPRVVLPVTIREADAEGTFPTPFEAACWLMAHRMTHDEVKRLRNQTRVHLERNMVLFSEGVTLSQLDSSLAAS